MADTKQYGPDETIGLLKARSEATGADNFTIKIFRKRQLGDRPDCIAVVNEAQIVHVANPEQWISRLCGGGTFQLSIYHRSDPTLPIGGMINFTLDGQPRFPDHNALRAADWAGPRELSFPPPGTTPQQVTSYTSLPQGGFPAGMQSTAPPNTVPGTPQLGSPHTFVDPRVDQLAQQLTLANERLAAQAATYAAEKLADRERQAEERRQNDLKAFRVEADAKHAAILAEMRVAQSTQKPAAGMTEIIAALSPIVAQVLAGQAKAAEQHAALAAASTAKTDALLASLISRPAIDPALLTIIAAKSDNSDVSHYVDAMSGMAKMSTDLIRTAADINMGQNPPEHPGMMAIREVSKGLALIGAGMSQSLKKKNPPPRGVDPRSVPAGNLPARGPTPVSTPVAAAPQGTNGAHHPSGNGLNGHGATPVPQGAAAFAGVPEVQIVARESTRLWATPGQRPEGPDVIEQLKAMIFAYAPINDVSLSFIYSLNEPAMIAELDLVDWSINEVISKHLGEWAMADPAKNASYLRDLAVRVEVLGRESGIFEDDDGDEDGDDDQEDESESQEQTEN